MRRCHWIVLIVLLLAGMIVGGLLPAINNVREAAARMCCHSNLKGLAIGLYTYADTNRMFPGGTIPNAELPPDRRLSWIVSLLPYIEQVQVFNQFDVSYGAFDPRNQIATDHRFKHLVCPASGEYEYDEHGGKWKAATPLTHYVGVAGVGEDAAYLSAGHARAGIFGYDRRTPFPDKSPMSYSQTLTIIETAHNPGHWAHGGPATLRGIEPGNSPYIGEGRPFGGFHDSGWFWGREHSITCSAAFADGTVRSLSSTIVPEMLEALATLGNKESLARDW
jgi:hypothetical protein